jgi:hypothetical protein
MRRRRGSGMRRESWTTKLGLKADSVCRLARRHACMRSKICGFQSVLLKYVNYTRSLSQVFCRLLIGENSSTRQSKHKKAELAY